MRRVATTLKVRVSRSVLAVEPVPDVAVNVMLCVPVVKSGSGTSVVSKASASRGPLSKPRVFEVTRTWTGSPGAIAEPKTRTGIEGRSATRYSLASEASTKNGNPTGTSTDP